MKIKLYKLLIPFFLFCFAASFCCVAQTVPTIKRLGVYMHVAPGDSTLSQGDLSFHSNTQLNGTVFIYYDNDTLTIDSVHIKLGSSLGAGDLFERTFANVPGTFNDGTWLTQMKNKLEIGIGTFTGLNIYYLEATLENSAGTSPVAKYAKK